MNIRWQKLLGSSHVASLGFEKCLFSSTFDKLESLEVSNCLGWDEQVAMLYDHSYLHSDYFNCLLYPNLIMITIMPIMIMITMVLIMIMNAFLVVLPFM